MFSVLTLKFKIRQGGPEKLPHNQQTIELPLFKRNFSRPKIDDEESAYYAIIFFKRQEIWNILPML
jgi:hypothetical protein